jgi:nucleoside-diphosphate-sugar epimerase
VAAYLWAERCGGLVKVAVVGSAGYVGTAFCPALKAHELLQIDAGLWGTPPAGTVVCHRALEILGRLRAFKPDCVVYLAALAHDLQGKLSPQLIRENNAWVPASICQWALREGRRFVGVSSYSIFAGPGCGAYCDSKRELEDLLGDLCLYRGASIVRLGTLFGATHDTTVRSFRPHLLLNSMLIDALATGEVRVDKTPRTRPVCPLDWAISALVSLVEEPVPGNLRNMHLCSGYLVEFAHFVAGLVPGAKVVERESPAQDARDYSFPPTIGDKDMSDMLKYEMAPLKDFVGNNLKALVRRRDECWGDYYRRAGAMRLYS